MRLAILALILAVPRAPLTAQQPSAIQPGARGNSTDSAAMRTQDGSAAARPAVEAAEPGKVQLAPAAIDSLRELIARFRRDPQTVRLPATDDVAMGGLTIAAGSQVAGPVAAAGGPLHIYGTVNGDAIAIGSDVIVHTGGRVTGNAIAALGSVTLDGGTVVGEMRQLAGAIGEVPRAATAPESPVAATRHAVALASSWLVILVLIGIGVLVFANTLSGRRHRVARGSLRAIVLGRHRRTARARAGPRALDRRTRGHDPRHPAHSLRDRRVRARGRRAHHAGIPRGRADHGRLACTWNPPRLPRQRCRPSRARCGRRAVHGTLGGGVGIRVGTNGGDRAPRHRGRDHVGGRHRGTRSGRALTRRNATTFRVARRGGRQ